MKDILTLFEDILREGASAVVATVVGTRGSTPGKETMRLVIREDGGMVGTIGGGCVEADVRDVAMAVLGEGRTRLVRFNLTEGSGAGRSGLICGGSIDVLLQPLVADPCWAAAREIRDAGGRATLVTVVSDGEPPAALALLNGAGAIAEGDIDLGLAAAGLAKEARESDEPRRARLNLADVELDVFVEPIALPMLWIHGGGHVSLELADIMVRAGWRVGVVDDRAEFANPKRFPMASTTIAAPFPVCLDRVPAGPRDRHVIVTRGHHQDETVLRWALGRDAASIGMIGSRRKVRTIFDHLLAEGVSEESLRRVRAPIGLHVGAATAAEIAVSIAAELIAERRLGPEDAPRVGRRLSSIRGPLS